DAAMGQSFGLSLGHTDYVVSVSLSPDGTHIMSGSSDTTITAKKSILAPSMTFKGHGRYIGSISYFPGGQRMISGSRDKTVRQWDLKEGKEIEELRDVCKEEVQAVAVSSDSRWVVTVGGDWEDADSAELKVCEVETGIVKNLPGHSDTISCIDISADNTLVASGSFDRTARIWNLETGKLVARPFESVDWVGSVRFSTDSKKLAVELWGGNCLETIYEFDASTLETVGTPFEGHIKFVSGLALSFDCALLASSSYYDEIIKLWAFESRQLLASFDVQNPSASNLILSPDSRKLAYTTY
ncbi:WD40 repeat-like protein, partial [Suillus brevipes Sb2]